MINNNTRNIRKEKPFLYDIARSFGHDHHNSIRLIESLYANHFLPDECITTEQDLYKLMIRKCVFELSQQICSRSSVNSSELKNNNYHFLQNRKSSHLPLNLQVLYIVNNILKLPEREMSVILNISIQQLRQRIRTMKILMNQI